MATDWTTRKRQIAAKPMPCEVPGCRMYARRPNRYCPSHDRNLRSRGHHTVGRVTLRELKPWKRHALDFIERNATHPGFVAALEWLEERARVAAAADVSGRSHTRNIRPAERVRVYWSQMRRDAVDLRMVIAYGIACELHRLYFPERWPDLRHAEFNSGHAYASLIRGRVKSGKSEGRDTAAMRTPAGYLCALAQEIRGALLPLFVKAAHTIKTQADRAAQPIPPAVLQQPFSSSQSASNTEATP